MNISREVAFEQSLVRGEVSDGREQEYLFHQGRWPKGSPPERPGCVTPDRDNSGGSARAWWCACSKEQQARQAHSILPVQLKPLLIFINCCPPFYIFWEFCTWIVYLPHIYYNLSPFNVCHVPFTPPKLVALSSLLLPSLSRSCAPPCVMRVCVCTRTHALTYHCWAHGVLLRCVCVWFGVMPWPQMKADSLLQPLALSL